LRRRPSPISKGIFVAIVGLFVQEFKSSRFGSTLAIKLRPNSGQL
jgi:hypothetical protein